jgi:hypothetical protein
MQIAPKLIGCAVALLLGWNASPARAQGSCPPQVPPGLEVPPGNRLFIKSAAVGTQNYICLPTATGVAWTFFAPQATLFDGSDKQIITHFLSIPPGQETPRAIWQSSKDTSAVWARAIASAPNGDGNIPLLLLEVVAQAKGPTGGQRLVATTFIHRLNTAGGVAPATGCSQTSDVGARAFVPYEATYLFYRPGLCRVDEPEEPEPEPEELTAP